VSTNINTSGSPQVSPQAQRKAQLEAEALASWGDAAVFLSNYRVLCDELAEIVGHACTSGRCEDALWLDRKLKAAESALSGAVLAAARAAGLKPQ
jgi:hypothetical protein